MKTIINTLKAIILIVCIIPLSSGKSLMAQNTEYTRYGAVGFSIGTKGYIGTGINYINGIYIQKKDFWEYDPATDSWTQKADVGGSVRYFATGFSIGNLGYIGTGVGNSVWLKDFWEYNPMKNKWTRKADIGGTGREFAAGFSIGNKGYIGIGYIYSGGKVINLKDFWEYDPKGNGTWTRKADFIGTPRYAAVGFGIGNNGYLGTGANYVTETTTHTYYKDFYKYTPGTTSHDSGTWTRIADFSGTARAYASGFSINSTKGYIGTGIGIEGLNTDFWEYDPKEIANPWKPKANFPGTSRDVAVGFSIGTRGYIGTGELGNYIFAEDFWEYNQSNDVWTRKTDFGSKHQGSFKDDANCETALISNKDLIVYPNPSNSTFNFRLQTMNEEPVNIKIFDIMGRLVQEYKSLSPSDIMTVGENLNAGVYFAIVTQGEFRKIVKINKVE